MTKPVNFYGNVFEIINYDFSNPLEVNEVILRQMLKTIETQYNNKSVSLTMLNKLLEYANRFEGMKCKFNNLIEKKSVDVRPYLYFIHNCETANPDLSCEEKTLNKLYSTDQENYKIELLNLCESNKSRFDCVNELKTAIKTKKIPAMTNYYILQYNSLKFESLFKLRSNHRKFTCQKVVNQGINVQMILPIYNGGFSNAIFNELQNAIAQAWSKNNFTIKFKEVFNPFEAKLKLTPIENQISHVFDDEPSTIYLDKNLDLLTLKKVVSHEFGHTLGFPDCYIEFFDSNKLSLVYYELSSTNKNIMCSLKYGVEVYSSYIDQIKQNSCIFE
jgi:hypothetical protein